MSLAKYQFLPWLREGLGNTIAEPDTRSTGGVTGGRAVLPVRVEINGQAAGTKDFMIVGPADVIGFSRDLVIRTEPVNWSTTFAPNLLAHIEFYEEDFPWRYTPAKAIDDQLRPWISLIVLKEDEFTRNETVVPLPRIEIKNPSVLPDYRETWLWAHVQKIESPTLVSDKAASDHIISRLICPRKLEANTRYFAFVVPTFESGRLAGLGKNEEEIRNVKSQDPAWGTPQQTTFPVYYEWFFRTADEMDFEYFASLLEARETDRLVGKKPIDCSRPGFGLPEYQELTLYMGGALGPPQSSGPVNLTDESETSLMDFKTKIGRLLNLTNQHTGDPVVTPPFYGQKHIFEKTLSLTENTWIHELNRDPAYRAAAGLGAKVFRKYQDLYLQKAWEQLESIVAANKIIDAANATLAVSQLLYEKNIKDLPTEEMIAFAGPVHVKVKAEPVNPGGKVTTLHESFRKSCFNGSAYSTAFRRLTSRRGAFRRKLEKRNVQGDGVISPLEPEMLKDILTARAAMPFTLLDAHEYWIQVIDRPEFNYQPLTEDQRPLDPSQNIEQAVSVFTASIQNPPAKAPCDQNIHHDLPDNIKPSHTITRLLSQTLVMPEADWFKDPLKIKAALVYPDFEDPMVEKLKELSMDWLAPNLHLIPNNSITLLTPNRKFIEAFMVGINVAMNREMRWREYPTDERGSSFRQFWDVKGIKDINDTQADSVQIVEQCKDISPIHTWKNWNPDPPETWKEKLDKFGEHNTRSVLPEAEQLVLAIRGDLLKCFPNTTIYAVKAVEETYTKDGEQLTRMKIDLNPEIKFPVFKAEVGTDLKFIGFDLTAAQAKGNGANPAGWFFVLQETPGEPRFGLDIQLPDLNAAGHTWTWDDASWKFVTGNYISADDDFSPIMSKMTAAEAARWRRTSADMAYILYQKPVMIAIHATEMLPE